MKTTTLRAHFDGEHIRLDEPFELEPDTPLTVTIWPKAVEDEEREDWLLIAGAGLERAYGEDEPDYPLSLLKEPNPDYERG